MYVRLLALSFLCLIYPYRDVFNDVFNFDWQDMFEWERYID